MAAIAEGRGGAASPARETVTVGLLADEGTPTKVATALAEQLCDVLSRRLSSSVDWKVAARSEQLSLDRDGQIPVDEFASERRAAYGWDVLVLLTDLPRRAGTQPIVSDFNAAQGVALLSVPALGAVRLKAIRRARQCCQICRCISMNLFEMASNVSTFSPTISTFASMNR